MIDSANIAGCQVVDADELTVLRCIGPGHTARKTFTPEGVQKFNAGMYFYAETHHVAGVVSLAQTLSALADEPQKLIIRGGLIEGTHQPCRRIKNVQANGDEPCFEAVPRRWVLIDMDSFELPAGVEATDVVAVAKAARALLPPAFAGAKAWAQLTGSAGVEPGGRVRLAFWLNQAITDAEAKAWLRGAPVDEALYDPIQPHYVARPAFVGGRADPVPAGGRMCLLPGEDAVQVPPAEELMAAVTVRSVGSKDDGEGGAGDPYTPDAELKRGIATGASYHKPLRNLAARAALRGQVAAVTLMELRALMDGSAGARDGRWQTRVDDIPRLGKPRLRGRKRCRPCRRSCGIG